MEGIAMEKLIATGFLFFALMVVHPDGARADDNGPPPETEVAESVPAKFELEQYARAAVDCFYAWNADLPACQTPPADLSSATPDTAKP
jgi:hypothetical protein